MDTQGSPLPPQGLVSEPHRGRGQHYERGLWTLPIKAAPQDSLYSKNGGLQLNGLYLMSTSRLWSAAAACLVLVPLAFPWHPGPLQGQPGGRQKALMF